MSSAEYCLWAAEFQRNPWDEERKDLRAGVVASAVANWAGKSLKENAQPVKPLDYMPYNQPPPQEIVPDFDYLTNFVNKAYAR